MLNVYCWRCGTKISEENILGLGHFDQNVGRYRGKGFVAFNCPKCNKARYQILDASYIALQNSISKKSYNDSPEVIDIDQVIDFHKMLSEINTVESFLEKCESSAQAISTEMKKPILQPIDVYNLFQELNSYNLKRLMILTLDKDNYLLSCEFLGEGSNRPISFEPKIIFHTPFLLDEQVSVIIAQNLNTNFSQPTQKDIMMTKRLIKAGKIIGVELLDHIVIEKDGFYSYDQLNYI
jgi:DNA repair protein RadC